MHLLLGLSEAAGSEGPRMQDLKGKEQESRGEASCCPIIPTHSGYWPACVSSTRNNKWEVRLQNKKISEPLTPSKWKDYSFPEAECGRVGKGVTESSQSRSFSLGIAAPSPLCHFFADTWSGSKRDQWWPGAAVLSLWHSAGQRKSDWAIPGSVPAGTVSQQKQRLSKTRFGNL